MMANDATASPATADEGMAPVDASADSADRSIRTMGRMTMPTLSVVQKFFRSPEVFLEKTRFDKEINQRTRWLAFSTERA